MLHTTTSSSGFKKGLEGYKERRKKKKKEKVTAENVAHTHAQPAVGELDKSCYLTQEEWVCQVAVEHDQKCLPISRHHLFAATDVAPMQLDPNKMDYSNEEVTRSVTSSLSKQQLLLA